MYSKKIYAIFSSRYLVGIRAMYTVSSDNDDLLYDIVAQFDNEEKCKSVFKEIVHQIGFLRYNLIRVSDM